MTDHNISREYFENYAGRSRPYSKVWKDHSYYDECCELFLREDAPDLKTMCVLGAATGQVLQEFHRRLKLKPYGCEINKWAHKQIPDAYRTRIRCQDMTEYVDNLRAKKSITI